jgi:ABC-type nitrate/sulfonate/bicarbonate transport system substrate-binding protein
MKRVRRITCAALLAAPLLLLAPGTRAAAQTNDQIVIATAPNDSSGEVFYAADLGYFTKAGLNVKVVPMNNAGAVAPAVVSGSVTIGGLSIPSIALAHEKGVPITIVAPGSVYSSAAPTSGIIVLKNSPLRKASDLNGKTIATRDLSNLSYYGANAWIDKNGGDSKSLHWIEISDTADIAAMQQGRVDAASVSEPALDDALHSEGRMLGPVCANLPTRSSPPASGQTRTMPKAQRFSRSMPACRFRRATCASLTPNDYARPTPNRCSTCWRATA